VPWAINPLVRLHWRGWGAEAVAFEEVSGDMVALDALEAAVAGCFESGSRDLKTLTQELDADLGPGAGDGLGEQLQAIIEDFVARGWLQPAEPM